MAIKSMTITLPEVKMVNDRFQGIHGYEVKFQKNLRSIFSTFFFFFSGGEGGTEEKRKSGYICMRKFKYSIAPISRVFFFYENPRNKIIDKQHNCRP